MFIYNLIILFTSTSLLLYKDKINILNKIVLHVSIYVKVDMFEHGTKQGLIFQV